MDKFILFDMVHLTIIAIGVALSFILILLAFFVRKDNLAKCLAVIILVLKITEILYRHNYLGEEIKNLLPLHLCNLSLVFAIITMFFSSKTFFQPLYFWGIGALFAIIFPEITLGIKDFSSISFFITHFFIIFSIIYGIIHFNFRVTKSGVISSFILINLIVLCVYYLNNKLSTNYLYLNYPPSSINLVAFFGPWPYYIFSVEGIYIALSFILYLPFRERKTKYNHF